MQLQPGVLVIAGMLSLALIVLPLGLPVWGRLLLLVTMPAWLGPIVIRFRQTQPRSAEFVPTSSGGPAAVRASFDATRDALASRAFVEVGRLQQTNSAMAMAGFVQLLEHPNSYAVCSRLVIADPASDELRANLVVFVTERTVGPALVTSNAATIVPFPPNPRFDTVWFPDVRDPAKLYALHGARVSQPGAGVARRTTVASDPVDYQRRLETASKEHMVRCGYWWLDADTQVYRPTWKGAILMALRLLPPCRQLIRWQRTRRAAAVRHAP
jgi:hypothetical protein